MHKHTWYNIYYLSFAVVGGVRAVRFSAQGRRAGDAGADRPHQALRRTIPGLHAIRQRLTRTHGGPVC